MRANDDEHVATFVDSVFSSGFIPLMTLPTRYSLQYGTSSLIDNIFMKSVEDLNPTSHVFTHKISDHFGCLTNFDFFVKKSSSSKIFVNVTPKSEANFELFSRLLAEENICRKIDTSPNANPSDNYEIIESCIKKAHLTAFPTKQVRFNKYKHKRNPWITNGLLKSVHERDKMYKKLRKMSPNSESRKSFKSEFQKFDRILKKTIRVAKQNYYFQLFESSKSNIKKTWQHINNILNRGNIKSSFPECFDIDGCLVSDPARIAESFNNFFVNVGPGLASKMPDVSDRVKFEDFLEPVNCNFNFSKINTEGVIKAIDSLKPKASYGYDSISTELLKYMKYEIAEPLSIIINQSFETGIFPSNLKIAKVIPVYKKDDNRKIDNYRPISLLPAISKVFEKIIHSQLLEYFLSNKLLYDHQYGFRPGHSTEHAILEFIDKILTDMSNDKIPLSVFIDLSKAFDTLDHTILLHKLQTYGINDVELSLFRSYLTDRKQYVYYSGICSNHAAITTGVPQGSILGPLLFLIYINDMSRASTFFHILSYADDTTLTCIIDGSDLHNFSTKLNNELCKIDDWLTVNKLSLNVGKTKYMIFAKPQKVVPDVFPMIRTSALEMVNEFNFLGVLIDSALTWKPHLNKIASKIAKCVGILSRFKNMFPNYVLVNIYNALIGPYLNYAVLAWGFANTSRILKLQKKGIRFICKAPYRAHALPLFKSLKLLTIDDLFLSAILKFYFKLVNDLQPSYFVDLKPRPATHTINTRFKNLLTNSSASKVYCDQCVRFAIPKLVNFSMKGSTGIDESIYLTNFRHDKLFTKSRELIAAIISKVHSHSLNGYCLYVKTRFLEEYV